jgi:hypothetical protein
MKTPWIHGEWAGLIALVLAVGVTVSLVVDITIVALHGSDISGANANLLSTLFGASIGVVGTYIGAHGRHGSRRTDETADETTYGRREDDKPGGDDGQLRGPDRS